MSNASRTATLEAVCALILGLGTLACGGDSASSAGTQSASASGGEHTHASGETHSHEGESSQAGGSQDQHTHADGTTHVHAAMDTVARQVGLQGDGSELGGHVTVLRGADTLRVMVEVQGASADARYDARLLAGDCGAGGDSLSSLTPVLTGPSGSGSSQATVAGSTVSGHSHGAVFVEAAGGKVTACAPVHLGGEHSHGG